jgi:hypothetical protein
MHDKHISMEHESMTALAYMQEWCDNHISMTTTTTKLAWKMEA